MRSLLIRLALVAIAAICLTVVLCSEAYADTKCAHVNPATGVCVVHVEVPDAPSTPGTQGDDGPRDSGSGAACYWDPSAQRLPGPPAGPVPCRTQFGYWSNAYHCYLRAARPQPPAGDPSWRGHDPVEGTVYECFQPQTSMFIYVWSRNPPPPAGTGPTPRQVAQLAVEQMSLSAIDIGLAPEPGPDSVGLVGMPVWMWVDHPNRHTYGPITATASVGGTTISATAKVLQVTWDMGDGAEVICDTKGTPYKPSYGRTTSPDCGHVYMKSSGDDPDGKFTVTATSDWVVTWSGAGQTGTIRLGGLTRSTQITIGEAQVLVH
jgi:hypothetical protein